MDWFPVTRTSDLVRMILSGKEDRSLASSLLTREYLLIYCDTVQTEYAAKLHNSQMMILTTRKSFYFLSSAAAVTLHAEEPGNSQSIYSPANINVADIWQNESGCN